MFSSRVLMLISRGNTLIFFLQNAQSANSQSGAVTLFWRKTTQKADIFQMNIYLCFFEDAGICIYG